MIRERQAGKSRERQYGARRAGREALTLSPPAPEQPEKASRKRAESEPYFFEKK